MIENKGEVAYRRGDLFDKRRKLMKTWATYCAALKAAKVVAFRRWRRKRVVYDVPASGRHFHARRNPAF